MKKLIALFVLGVLIASGLWIAKDEGFFNKSTSKGTYPDNIIINGTIPKEPSTTTETPTPGTTTETTPPTTEENQSGSIVLNCPGIYENSSNVIRRKTNSSLMSKVDFYDYVYTNGMSYVEAIENDYSFTMTGYENYETNYQTDGLYYVYITVSKNDANSTIRIKIWVTIPAGEWS